MIKWEQWYLNGKLLACGYARSPDGRLDCRLVAVWDEDRWLDQTHVIFTEDQYPSDMEFIAMWAELPEPIEKLGSRGRFERAI